MDATKKLSLALALVLTLFLPSLASAQVPDAKLYEATETMRRTAGKVQHRLASSTLAGFALPATAPDPANPLCPPELVSASGQCTVNAFGSNNINLTTGMGPVSGDFTIVTKGEGENPVEIEEEEGQRGNFRGQMDLSLAGATGLGTMDATLTVEKGRGNHPFRAVIRIPFPCDPPSSSTGYCYSSSGPDAVPTGIEPVLDHEFAFGKPMVRLDIYFE